MVVVAAILSPRFDIMLGINEDAPAADTPIGLHHLTGDLCLHSKFRSEFLTTERDVLVYLPPGYRRDDGRRYPVLYLHDGQNLFDGATSFIPGKDWRVNQTAQSLIDAGEIVPLIIVGIYNAGGERIDEYTPTRDARFKMGGKAAQYGRMLVEELKPFIDANYRTLEGAPHTGLGGSSLGGLVTLYLGIKYPAVFNNLAVVSPSVWWDGKTILREVNELHSKPAQRIWMDMGTDEGPHSLQGARLLRDALVAKGWTLDADLKYFEADGAKHDEHAWADRVAPILRYLYPTSAH